MTWLRVVQTAATVVAITATLVALRAVHHARRAEQGYREAAIRFQDAAFQAMGWERLTPEQGSEVLEVMSQAPMQCPHCELSLDGGPIRQSDGGRVDDDNAAQLYGETRRWSKAIGVEVRGIYDGVVAWKCPHCGEEWPRFPEDDRRTIAWHALDRGA